MNRPTTHLSIDLETLGLGHDAVVLSIAIVSSEGPLVAVLPDIDEQLAEGRLIEDGTLRWWLRQDEGARTAIAQGGPIPLGEARRVVTRFLEEQQRGATCYVWGNAPSFDCEILAHFLGERPWRWYRERDVRTARMLLPENTRPATAHSALDDARAQLEDVLRYLRLADGVTAPEVPRHG